MKNETNKSKKAEKELPEKSETFAAIEKQMPLMRSGLVGKDDNTNTAEQRNRSFFSVVTERAGVNVEGYYAVQIGGNRWDMAKALGTVLKADPELAEMIMFHANKIQ